MSLTAFNRQRRLVRVEEMKPENILQRTEVEKAKEEKAKVEPKEVKEEKIQEEKELKEEKPTRRRRRTN